MSAAVRSLRDEGKYNGKLRFYVIDVDSAKVRQEIARWEGLGNHGLVGTTAKGAVLGMLPGHSFGKAQIEQKIAEVIKATSPPT